MGYSVFQHAVVIRLSTSQFQQAAECRIPSLSGWFAGSVLNPCIFISVYMCVCVSRIFIICIFQSVL